MQVGIRNSKLNEKSTLRFKCFCSLFGLDSARSYQRT